MTGFYIMKSNSSSTEMVDDTWERQHLRKLSQFLVETFHDLYSLKHVL